MPWKDKGTPQFKLTGNPAEQGLLRRLQMAARMSKYDGGEAEDIARAGVEAAARHMATTCPDADFVVIGCVPFGFDAATGRGPGNAIAQRITGGTMLGESMRDDVIPQLARLFTKTDSRWSNFLARLEICKKILFGKDPRGYERNDA
jgi:hypothetical protein